MALASDVLTDVRSSALSTSSKDGRSAMVLEHVVMPAMLLSAQICCYPCRNPDAIAGFCTCPTVFALCARTCHRADRVSSAQYAGEIVT